MAHLPPYNPRADIAFLYGEIEKLRKNYDKLMKAVENATIIDKGEGDLQVVYDISNGNKESDKLQGRNSQESKQEKPRRNGGKKKSNNKQDTEQSQV